MTHQDGDRSSEQVTVDALRAKRAGEAGELFAASHADYPAFRHLFPDVRARHRMLEIFMAAACRDAAVHAKAMVAQGEGVLGVALWMPPGTYPLSPRRKARMTPALLRAAVVARGRFPAFARVGATLEKAHPRDSSWYLQALGVHPDAQGRGIGRQLVTPVLDIADDAGLPCHLHTSDPKNVAYYERYGFEVSQPAIEVFEHGPHYIGMSRTPR